MGSMQSIIYWSYYPFIIPYTPYKENNRMGKTRDLFKKIRDTKGTFHAKMRTIKERNGMDLTEAEDIKKTWQEYKEKSESCSVVSNSLRLHESQHARPPCPSPTPGLHSYSRPSSQWCHPAISSSVVPFSSCPQSLPASESFPRSQFSREVAKVLEFQLQHHSFQRTPRADLL